MRNADTADLRPFRIPSSALRVILFDAVGTLIYPEPPVAEAYHAAGLRHGSQLPVESIRLRFRSALAHQETRDADLNHRTNEEHERQRWRAIVAEVFHDLHDTDELFQTLWDHFAQPRHWRVYDDVPECLAQLTRAGYTLGIASNFDERLHHICNHHAVLAQLQRFVSSRIGHKKPGLEFFRAIERSLELPAEQILIIGDDLENDFYAPRRAGWHATLLDRQAEAPDPTGAPTLRTLGGLPARLSIAAANPP